MTVDKTMGRQLVLANNKTSAKLSWKRKEALQISECIRDYFADKGFPLPPAYQHLFGKGFKLSETVQRQALSNANTLFPDDEFKDRKAHYESEVKLLRKDYKNACERRAERFFTDTETGECFYDDYVELAKAYYTLRNGIPAMYSIFPHKTNNHFLKQLVASLCSRHRLDPVWNYKKSKLIRGLWHRYLRDTQIHKQFQPMHLMLTVPHTNGEWMGKEFYAREFIEKFNILRKYKGWKRIIHGGEYGIEVTRSGKDGLHIHLHSLVFQRKEFSRDLVNRYIRQAWHHLTGAQVTWYETLYVHRKDSSGKFIMEASDGGIPIIDKAGRFSRLGDMACYELETDGIKGKRKKFYLDEKEVWFGELSEEDKLKHFCDGVMECIKYHFKNDCFKTKDGQWDVDLMKDVLKNSRNLRMYSKFGAFYREKALNYSRLEQPVTSPEDETALIAEGVNPDSDGVEGRIINPYTSMPAQSGEYVVVLALPQDQIHGKDSKGNMYAAVSNQVHDVFFKIRHGTPIREVINAIMMSQYERILIEEDLDRLKNFGWRAKRNEKVW